MSIVPSGDQHAIHPAEGGGQPSLPCQPDGSGAMFDGIVEKYDQLNRILSFGMDQRWRKTALTALGLAPGGALLDIATGTADLALAAAQMEPKVTVVALDQSPRMLERGLQKAVAAGVGGRVRFLRGDALALPFGNGVFDACAMAFGIRNLPGRVQALAEMARVTRPDGRIAILELSEPRGRLMAPLARFHIHAVVPWLGGLLSGGQEYRYLQQSVHAFPTPVAFSRIMETAGIELLRVEPLSFGVCVLFVGRPCRSRPPTSPSGKLGQKVG